MLGWSDTHKGGHDHERGGFAVRRGRGADDLSEASCLAGPHGLVRLPHSVKAGDTIAALDDAPPGRFTLGDLRERLSHEGEHHDLTIARGGDSLTVPVVVRLVSLDAK